MQNSSFKEVSNEYLKAEEEVEYLRKITLGISVGL